MHQNHKAQIGELHREMEQLQSTLFRINAEADADRTTLSRQLFVLQTELSTSTQTIERMSQELLQIDALKKKDAQSESIIR